MGLGLHGLAVGHVPPVPFVGVAMVGTLVMMMTWRTAYAVITPAAEVGQFDSRDMN